MRMLCELFCGSREDPTSAKRNSSYSTYSILFLTYTSYFGGKKGISRNKMKKKILMQICAHTPCLQKVVAAKCEVDLSQAKDVMQYMSCVSRARSMGTSGRRGSAMQSTSRSHKNNCVVHAGMSECSIHDLLGVNPQVDMVYCMRRSWCPCIMY